MLNKENKPDSKRLFEIQTGTIVGNIYADGTHKREEITDIKKIKKDNIIKNSVDRCC